MDLKLDLTKAVKIVIAKDENHHIEYIIDNGEIKDVNIIQFGNTPPTCCYNKQTTSFDDSVDTSEFDDRYFIDKATPLAEKIISGRKMVATVQDAISDTSNPAALHAIINDGTTDVKEPRPILSKTEASRSVLKEDGEFVNYPEAIERSKKIIELVKNGEIDKRAKKRRQISTPKIIYNFLKSSKAHG